MKCSTTTVEHYYKNPLFTVDKNEAQVLMFIYWDCKILSGTATFHIRGVLDCNFQNPSEIPALIRKHFMPNVSFYAVI